MNEASPAAAAAAADELPEAWACVEIFGHRRHYGRYAEVERFGTKMLRIDVPNAAGGFDTFFYGGGSIFSLTPMTEEAARKWAARDRPRAYEPMSALPPPDPLEPGEEDEEDEDAA